MDLLRPQLQRSFVLSLLALASTSLVGCGGGGGGGGPADLSGTITFVPEGTTLPVIEPNDGVDEAQPIGEIHAGTRIALHDDVSPANDPRDAFRLIARERVRLSIDLVRLRGEGRAPDLMIYDPVAMRPLAVDRDGHAQFTTQGVYDIVVRATDAPVQYALRIRAARAASMADESATGDVELGQLGAGAEFTFPTLGQARRASFTAREAFTIDSAAFAGSARLFDESAGNVELVAGSDGLVHVAALSRIAVELAPSTSATPIALRTHAPTSLAPNATAPAALAHRFAAASSAPALELENSEHGFYGTPRLESTRAELLVRFDEGADAAQACAARGLGIVDAIPGDAQLARFELSPFVSANDASRIGVALAASLASDAHVLVAERNLVRHALGAPVTPNDTYYSLQWHYPLIHLPEAWTISTGNDAVITAVIDTGETDHPDLVNRQIAGYDFISSAANAADGDGRDADPTDVGDGTTAHPSSFHGTHVAGTIGAETNNAAGVAGVTWAGKVMHLRVLGKEGGTDFDIANAIRYAARLANASSTLPAVRANLINMSLGGPGSSSTVQSAVTAARAAGVAIFAASGNENSSAPSYPAAYTGVISVAAVDANGNRAPYSNFGSTIDIAAPGGDTSVDQDGNGYADGVLSTLIDDAGGGHVPIFAFYQGTSMACPHAAGVASLMLAVNPALTPDQIETILKNTATDLGTPGRDNFYGNGLIHAERALLAAQGGAGSPTPVMALSPQTIAFGTSLSTVSVAVTNTGGGILDVDTISITTSDSGTWLAATPVAVAVPTTTDTSSITVHVDRTGIVDGNYTGTITVISTNGGSQVIDVSMTVDSTLVPIDVDIFVLAVRIVDAQTFETVDEAVVNPTTGLDFNFAALPEGDYLIAAGSDDDVDGFICGDGDLYCGLYPTFNEPELVTVNGSNVDQVDFPVTGAEAPGPVVGGRTVHGFRLRRAVSR